MASIAHDVRGQGAGAPDAPEASTQPDLSYIADALRPLAVDVSQLVPDPANARKHDERNIAAIRSSLSRFGQRIPIVVQKQGMVVRAGNGRLQAAKLLGWTHIAAVIVDEASIDATAYAIADNRTAELAEWDDAVLAGLLESLPKDIQLAAGFNSKELGDLLNGLADSTAQAQLDAVSVFTNESIICDAFKWFRASGFPYRNLPIHVCKQEINALSQTDSDALYNTKTGYGVADTYHPHRFHANAVGMKCPVDSFADDKLLARAIGLELVSGRVGTRYFGSLGLVSGTQAASNFRPGYACGISRKYCKPGDTVLDTSTGYGGRLVGFIASGIAGKYIGIDPNTLTHAGNTKLASDLGFADRVELHNSPAEDVDASKLAGTCDFAFTSPPYFCKERYSTEPTQSWVRYKTGDAWRNGFLKKMLALQFAALKSGSYNIVNIAPVNIGSDTYPLDKWCIEDGIACGLEYIETKSFGMNVRCGSDNDDAAAEPVIVFRKP